MTPEVEATRPEPNAPVPDERERLIESLTQLISAGRPLSEVLLEAKVSNKKDVINRRKDKLRVLLDKPLTGFRALLIVYAEGKPQYL